MVNSYHNKGIDQYVRALIYSIKSWKSLSSDVTYCKVLSLHREGQGLTKIFGIECRRAWLLYHPLHLQGKLLWTRLPLVTQKTANWFETIDGNDTSRRYPYFMCHAMPGGLYTRWELDFEPCKLMLPESKTRNFENMVMS